MKYFRKLPAFLLAIIVLNVALVFGQDPSTNTTTTTATTTTTTTTTATTTITTTTASTASTTTTTTTIAAAPTPTTTAKNGGTETQPPSTTPNMSTTTASSVTTTTTKAASKNTDPAESINRLALGMFEHSIVLSIICVVLFLKFLGMILGFFYLAKKIEFNNEFKI